MSKKLPLKERLSLIVTLLVQAEKNLQQYFDDALAQQGKKAEDFNVGQLRLFYVAPTRDQAWDEAQYHAHYMMEAYDKWLKEAADVQWFQETMSVSSMPSPEELRHDKDLTFLKPL